MSIVDDAENLDIADDELEIDEISESEIEERDISLKDDSNFKVEELEETEEEQDIAEIGIEHSSKLTGLLSNMTDDQQNRYETFRTASFPKPLIKKILTTLLQQNIPEKMAVIVSGVAKIFVGELVEQARVIMREQEEKGPLKPVHIREVVRRNRYLENKRSPGNLFM
jgi:transcription initiation factor TFIID subunit 11